MPAKKWTKEHRQKFMAALTARRQVKAAMAKPNWTHTRKSEPLPQTVLVMNKGRVECYKIVRKTVEVLERAS